jgi:alkylhydroperoxidase family enzyme
VSDEKLEAVVGELTTKAPFDARERAALAYADAMTLTGGEAYDADDALFATLRTHFSDDQIVALTAIIAWENASSKFNRALRIPAQGLWKRGRRKEGGGGRKEQRG